MFPPIWLMGKVTKYCNEEEKLGINLSKGKPHGQLNKCWVCSSSTTNFPSALKDLSFTGSMFRTFTGWRGEKTYLVELCWLLHAIPHYSDKIEMLSCTVSTGLNWHQRIPLEQLFKTSLQWFLLQEAKGALWLDWICWDVFQTRRVCGCNLKRGTVWLAVSAPERITGIKKNRRSFVIRDADLLRALGWNKDGGWRNPFARRTHTRTACSDSLGMCIVHLKWLWGTRTSS